MKTTLPITLAALLLAAPTAAQDLPNSGPAIEEESLLTEGEVKLAKLLGDRIAGEPQRCLPTFGERSMTIIDDTALVFDYGSTLYVSIPQDPRGLDDSDRLVTRKNTTRLCSIDLVQTEDRSTGFYTGNLMLGDFIPYRRPD